LIGASPAATSNPDIAIAGGDAQLSWASPSSVGEFDFALTPGTP